MARGGYQKQRIAQKKAAERKARKRAHRKRTAIIWGSSVIALGLIATLILSLAGGSDDPSFLASGSPSPGTDCTPSGLKKFDAAPKMEIDSTKTYTATMTTTEGTITVALFAKDAPQTVNNFVFLARQKFYDCSKFHRVIPDFGGPGSDMIQGGDAAKGDGSGDPGYSFGDENLIPFDKPGLLAMANSGPGTNGSQFFIGSGTIPHLNEPGKCPAAPGVQASCHSIFGQVTAGLDVVTKIAKKQGTVVRSVTIEEA